MQYYEGWGIEDYSRNEYLEWLEDLFCQKGYAFENGYSANGDTINLLCTDFVKFVPSFNYPDIAR